MTAATVRAEEGGGHGAGALGPWRGQRAPPRPRTALSVLVDAAIWRGRAGRYAHLASDASYAELHAFASRLGLPSRAFHRDHYDLPEALRQAAIALGAEPVDSRQLVRRLRDAGLLARRPPPAGGP